MSILGTLAATAILAGLKAEWPARTGATHVAAAAPALPSLTSGGKFAARAEDGDGPEPFVTLTALPPILPMFTAPTIPDLRPAAVAAPPVVAEATVVEPPAPPPKPLRSAARHETRRVAAAPSQPPRRDAPAVIAMARLPDMSVGSVEDRSMWWRSKLAYRQVAAWSGSLVDHLLP